MARHAKIEDIRSILPFAEARFHASSMASDMRYNGVIFQQSLRRAILDANCCAIIDHRHGEVCALLLGSVDQVPWSVSRTATDIVFVATHRGDAVLDLFHAWAEMRGACRVYMGISEPDPDGRIGRLYARHGMQQAGGVFHKQLAPRALHAVRS